MNVFKYTIQWTYVECMLNAIIKTGSYTYIKLYIYIHNSRVVYNFILLGGTLFVKVIQSLHENSICFDF